MRSLSEPSHRPGFNASWERRPRRVAGCADRSDTIESRGEPRKFEPGGSRRNAGSFHPGTYTGSSRVRKPARRNRPGNVFVGAASGTNCGSVDAALVGHVRPGEFRPASFLPFLFVYVACTVFLTLKFEYIGLFLIFFLPQHLFRGQKKGDVRQVNVIVLNC